MHAGMAWKGRRWPLHYEINNVLEQKEASESRRGGVEKDALGRHAEARQPSGDNVVLNDVDQ